MLITIVALNGVELKRIVKYTEQYLHRYRLSRGTIKVVATTAHN